jgi:hypothetical protein
MDWLAYPLGNLIVWIFDSLLVPFGELSNSDSFWFLSPNLLIVVIGFLGLFIWLSLQSKYNKRAEKDPNQIK